MFNGPALKLFSFITSGGRNISGVEVVISFFAVFVILLLVFPAHECAHALMAKLLGDDTAEREGRLTLNPMRHIEPMGALMMLLFSIGYAKPVPVNASRCTKVKPKSAMAITAAAGPLSNIIMAYIFLVIYKIISYAIIGSEAYVENNALLYLPMAFQYIATINLYLAVFNLIPIPPLDGSKILFFFLPPRLIYKFLQYQQIISLVFMALIFMTDTVQFLISNASGVIMNALNFLSGYIDLIMGG